MPSRTRSHLLALTLAAAGAGVACNSPTLPLPPPDKPETITSCTDPCIGDGCIEISGSVEGNSIVMALSDDTRAGVLVETTSDGTYTLRMRAKPGSVLEIWYRVGNRESATTTVEVP